MGGHKRTLSQTGNLWQAFDASGTAAWRFFFFSTIQVQPVGTIELRIPIASEHYDAVVAELESNAIGFLTDDDALRAYFPAEAWSNRQTEALLRWLRERHWDADIGTTFHANTNWNETWESSIQPIQTGRFLIRPTWSDPIEESENVTELVVDPKMSFGTGYHESTRLALQLLPDALDEGDRVLDMGAGTGILSIACCRLGAAHCLAVDIDPNAIENTPENAKLNGVAERIDVRKGSMDDVTETGFQTILANINRNVLHDMLPAFAAASTPGASLIMAGLLDKDESIIRTRAESVGYTVREVRSENEWIGMRLEK